MENSLLNFRYFRLIIIFHIAFSACLIIGYVYNAQGILIPDTGVILGRDFVNYYSAAQHVHAGNVVELYDPNLYWEYLRQTYRENMSFHNSSYPPHFLLLTYPLALLSYGGAYALWCVLGVMCFGFICFKLTRNKTDALILALAPASIMNIYFGQNGFLTGSLIIATFIVLPKRPIIAGLLLALLTVKPQLGILFPLILLLSRQYKAFISAGVFTVSLVLASIIAFGVEPWLVYLTETTSLQKQILLTAQDPFLSMISSVLGAGMKLDAPMPLVWALQILTSVLVILATIWVWLRQRNYKLQVAFSCVAILLVSPYVVNYDMMVLAPAAYLHYQFLSQQSDVKNGFYQMCFLGIMPALPVLTIMLNLHGITITPLFLMGFAGLILYSLHKSPSTNYGPWLPNFQFHKKEPHLKTGA